MHIEDWVSRFIPVKKPKDNTPLEDKNTIEKESENAGAELVETVDVVEGGTIDLINELNQYLFTVKEIENNKGWLADLVIDNKIWSVINTQGHFTIRPGFRSDEALGYLETTQKADRVEALLTTRSLSLFIKDEEVNKLLGQLEVDHDRVQGGCIACTYGDLKDTYLAEQYGDCLDTLDLVTIRWTITEELQQ